MTIEQLQQLKPLLNTAELARRAGINEQTLFAKLRRGTALSEAERQALHRVLREFFEMCFPREVEALEDDVGDRHAARLPRASEVNHLS